MWLYRDTHEQIDPTERTACHCSIIVLLCARPQWLKYVPQAGILAGFAAYKQQTLL
jgi:hypothetical protein